MWKSETWAILFVFWRLVAGAVALAEEEDMMNDSMNNEQMTRKSMATLHMRRRLLKLPVPPRNWKIPGLFSFYGSIYDV
tara:strand:+ start:178 stop:414 length:237 start_codon:yes stop_codon:yes gene_type:complete